MIAKDKLLHAAAGVVLGLSSLVLSLWWAIGLVVTVAVAKEVIWDWWLGKGTPEVMDAVATIVPGVVVVYFLSQ